MSDAPAVGRSQIPMTLPALGCEWLPIGQIRREHEIVDKPGGIACHDDADVTGLNVPIRKILLRSCVDLFHAVPALETANGRHYQNIRALQPDLRGQRDIRCVYRFQVFVEDLLDIGSVPARFGCATKARCGH